MGKMPRPRPPYLLREYTRHGKAVWYVRILDGPRIRIRSDYGSKAFMAEYQAALKGEAVQVPDRSRSGSLAWLWTRYRETAAWGALAPATRRARENIMVAVLAESGHLPFRAIIRKDIERAREKRAATPAQSRNFLDVMRGLFRWALAADHVSVDPSAGVTNPKRKKGPGFVAWTEADVAAYQAKWAIGTKERVWLDVLLYTGPRRGDVVRIGRQHERTITDPETRQLIRVISFKTEKGGEQIEVTIPILPILAVTLAAGPCGDLAYICGSNGRPLAKETFGNMFSAAARAAGVKKSAHGVRKIAATTAADNGATIHQLMAIFGWTTVDMPELYTREANRRRLARGGMYTLGRPAAEG